MVRLIAKRWKSPVFLAMAVGSCALLIGVSFGVIEGFKRLFNPSQTQQDQIDPTSTVLLPLLRLSPTQRAAPLEALAQLENSPEASRARYLLAADSIQQRQGQQALTWLEGLEENYPVLAAEIALKRAQAYEQTSDPAQAKAAWQALLKRYPDSPVAAEALYALGRTQPRYWDQAIAQFPAHPRTVEIAQARLKQNPKQPQLLLLLARHGLYLPESVSVLDQLTSQYKDQLKPADWEAIAFGYWEKQAYGQAGPAYAQAPLTPRNAYRAGRGLQLGQKKQEAYKAYQRMVTRFPQAKETPLALTRMASLAPQSPVALQSLDQAIQLSPLVGMPHQASEALLAKVRLLDRLDHPQAATQARQVLLTAYSSSNAAAELRWEEAQKWAARQDISNAEKLAQQVTIHNPGSEFAPAATFWGGKWASQLGHEAEAKTAFQHVLTHHPDSYYAWRAAVLLGWPVGDFATVRQVDPQIVKSTQRPALLSGSDALKELYQLGQDGDAWTRWQWEYRDPMNRTLDEQFTDGLLRLGVGDNLNGLFMISNLETRSQQEPETLPRYQALQRQPAYWQALYPFPFVERITAWSQERSLNPLLVTALIRQESRFQPTIRSIAGATGLMQVMPGTADWIADQVQLDRYKLEHPDDNIKLGTWYLDYTHQEYNNNSMLAVASYNAGPGNVANWVEQVELDDPDAFVEAIPFPETKDYVKAVFENYWNYLRLYNPEISQLLQKQS